MVRFWNFMGAVGLTYFCYYNLDYYWQWVAKRKAHWIEIEDRKKRAAQRATRLLKEQETPQ